MIDFSGKRDMFEVQWKATPAEERWRTAIVTGDRDIAESWYETWMNQGYAVQLLEVHMIPRVLKKHDEKEEGPKPQAVDAAAATAA
jgi:cobalamin-dependent methionine synthase I